jgi:transcriptional regulator with XRE-family HTH domain
MDTTPRIRTWRISHGYSLRKLGRMTGYNWSWYNDLEKGRRPFRVPRIAVLTHRLQVSVADLADPDDAEAKLAVRLLQLGLTIEELLLLLDHFTPGGAAVKGWRERQAVAQ